LARRADAVTEPDSNFDTNTNTNADPNSDSDAHLDAVTAADAIGSGNTQPNAI